MKKTPALVRINRSVRTASFAWCLVTIGLHLWGGDPSPTTWAVLALQFIVYPQLVYWRAVYSEEPRNAERAPFVVFTAIFPSLEKTTAACGSMPSSAPSYT